MTALWPGIAPEPIRRRHVLRYLQPQPGPRDVKTPHPTREHHIPHQWPMLAFVSDCNRGQKRGMFVVTCSDFFIIIGKPELVLLSYSRAELYPEGKEAIGGDTTYIVKR